MQLGPISSRRTVIWAQWEAGVREMGKIEMATQREVLFWEVETGKA